VEVALEDSYSNLVNYFYLELIMSLLVLEVLVVVVALLAQKEQTASILLLIHLLQLAVEQVALLMKVLVQEVWTEAMAVLAVAQEILLMVELEERQLAVKATLEEI
jgi:hypothetical protein